MRDDDDDDDEEFLDTFGKGIKTQFFPVLPVENDDDENDDDNNDVPFRGGTDENDNNRLNRVQLHNIKSPRVKESSKSYARASPNSSSKASSKASSSRASSSQESVFQLPTSMLTSFQRRKTSTSSSSKYTTPTEEDCAKRLSQIRREIDNVQQMIDATQNTSVQTACRKRVSRLKVERRMYQIVQERHKLRDMMEATEVPHVRRACEERFKQLIAELGELPLEEEEEEEAEDVVVENASASVKENTSVGRKGKASSNVKKNTSAEVEGPPCELVCGQAELSACDDKSPKRARHPIKLEGLAHVAVKSEGVQVGESIDDRSPRGDWERGTPRAAPIKLEGLAHVAVTSEGVQVGDSLFDNTGTPTSTVTNSISTGVVAKNTLCGEDSQWYGQALKYVTGEEVAKKTACGEDDGQWYDQAVKYVTGPSLDEGMAAARRNTADRYNGGGGPPVMEERRHPERKEYNQEHPWQGEHSSSLPPKQPSRMMPAHAESPTDRYRGTPAVDDRRHPERRRYHPEQQQEQQQALPQNQQHSRDRYGGSEQNQYGTRSQVRFSAENLHYDHYGPPPPPQPPPPQGSERRYSDGPYRDTFDIRSVASPASDQAVYQDNYQYTRERGRQQQQRQRSPVLRRPSPVARAVVDSSSSWFKDIKGEINDLLSPSMNAR
mmetsp:Transcript_16004/g.34566  ORF Transcript_16004/g.34566 Transcript_16004/m.34566 type:complete len:664 (+) Transcript_16004:19-2010(+)